MYTCAMFPSEQHHLWFLISIVGDSLLVCILHFLEILNGLVTILLFFSIFFTYLLFDYVCVNEVSSLQSLIYINKAILRVLSIIKNDKMLQSHGCKNMSKS